MKTEKKLKEDLIVSQMVELSLEEKSNDPVRNLYSVCINVGIKIESIMCELREQERRTNNEPVR